MNTTLQDLANEYDDSIKVQQKVIESNRKKLLQARSKATIRRLSDWQHFFTFSIVKKVTWRRRLTG